MFRGQRGRGNRPQYGPGSQIRFDHSAHSSGRGQNAGQISQVENRWQATPDSSNRWDEEESRFYEALQSHHDNHLWQKYKERLLQIEEDLFEEMEYYQQNPDRHPKHNSEWNEYWNGRTDDLLRKGEDPMKYDIKEEFFAYWDIKLRELFQDIFQKEKAQLQQEIQLMQAGQPGKLMVDERPKNEPAGPQPLISNKRSCEPVILGNKDELSDTFSKRIKPTENPEASVKSTPVVSVISVLRQLSVLEDHLGSLGPKVVDLLSKALLLEKSTGAVAVLKVEDNCIMLETVGEKLKGLLQAAMIPQSIIGVTETAVRNLSQLLTTVGENSSPDDKSFPDKKKPRPDERKPHPGDGKTIQDDRRPYPVESSLHQGGSNSYRGSKPYSDERMPYGLDETTTLQVNSFQDRRPYPGDGNTLQDERDLYRGRKPYPDERSPYDPSQANSFRDTNTPQIKRTYKISELSYSVEKFGFLSHLSILDKTAIAQKIASSLLSRGQTDIREDELLDQISEFTSRNKYSSDYQFGKRDAEAYFPRSSGYDQLSKEDSQRQRETSAIPSLFDNAVYSDLDSLYGINRSGHSSYGQETTRSYFPRGGNNNSSDRLTPVTYPLNSNPYQSSPQRKY